MEQKKQIFNVSELYLNDPLQLNGDLEHFCNLRDEIRKTMKEIKKTTDEISTICKAIQRMLG